MFCIYSSAISRSRYFQPDGTCVPDEIPSPPPTNPPPQHRDVALHDSYHPTADTDHICLTTVRPTTFRRLFRYAVRPFTGCLEYPATV